MKKITLLLAVMTVFTANIFAQETNQKFNLGIKAGGNFSNIYDTQGDSFTADGKLGFAGGVFMSIPIIKFIGIQPEVLFSQKGFKGKGVLLGSSYDLTRTTSYIDIPILLAIKPINMLTILAGPQFSFLLKEKNVFQNSLASVEQEEVFKNDNVRKNIMGFTGGLDLNFQSITLGLRANYDYQTNNGDGTSSTPRYKNAWYQATIGFRFL
ncbi:porin family protein [Arcicella rigui]|uniref:Porin family protein n=1 Tax=Arcicella rigui TaxID=797020 RepID=A0ABU5Q8E3_9BACT|nr:porin family protein [Arcicella rigui]MEA5139113.1 porin family protein [Arcicella rigui]